MALSDKLRLSSGVPSKIYLGKRRIDSIYRTDTKTQIFPFTPPLPVIDSVTPSSAPLAGGVQVTISGAYFSTTSSVKFGGVNASGFTIMNSTTIVATVPAGPAGSAPVVVTNATGASSPFPFSMAAAATPAGMETTDTFAPPFNTNTWIQVLGMSIRSGYPSTVIQNDALLISGNGAVSGSFYGNYTTVLGTQNFRVVRTRNGEATVVGTAARNSVTSFSDSVIQGDLISLECYFSTQYRNVSAGAYVTIDPA